MAFNGPPLFAAPLWGSVVKFISHWQLVQPAYQVAASVATAGTVGVPIEPSFAFHLRMCNTDPSLGELSTKITVEAVAS